MFFFRKSPKTFYSAILDDKSCRFYFREVASNKNILKEDSLSANYENATEIASDFSKFMENTNKKTITSTMVCIAEQGAVLQNENYQDQSLIYEMVAENFKIYYPRSELERLNFIFGVTFNQCMGALKVLYFLMKNQNFENRALFILKLESAMAMIVADQHRVYCAKMVDIAKSLQTIAENGELNEDIVNDESELFFRIIQDEIKRFYELPNSDFIEQIFIYDDDTLGAEIGYLLYTKVHIKTELVHVNLVEYINKISIKET